MGGEDKVTIFTMNKFITPHMVEKLDKSAYVYEGEVDGEAAAVKEDDEEQDAYGSNEDDETDEEEDN